MSAISDKRSSFHSPVNSGNLIDGLKRQDYL